VLGLAGALATPGSPRWLGFTLALATIAKLAFEARALNAINDSPDEVTPQRKTAQLLAGPLRLVNETRLFAAALGGVILPLTVALGLAPAALAWPALLFSLGGELAERALFFRAVDAPKMPGVGA
jgi:DMSO reductase anchor subunit